MQTPGYAEKNYSNTIKSCHLFLFSLIIPIAQTNGCLIPNTHPQRSRYVRRVLSNRCSSSNCKSSLSFGVPNAKHLEKNYDDVPSCTTNIEITIKNLLGAAFLERLEELKRYMADNNGSCMVPRRLGSLGIWVNKIRAQYQKYLKGEKTSLNSARIDALNEVGFVWVATGKNGRSATKAALWNSRFEEMKQFQTLHGHCNVPSNYAVSPHLKNWMSTQKLQYRNRREGKYSMLTQERIDALNSIGFNWNESRWDQLWHRNFKQLCRYKAEYGHCAVPISYANRQLAWWVSRQRQEYKKFIEGKASCMSEERRKLLEDIGFVWSIAEKEWSEKEAAF
jgi:hypothetical protein